MVVRPTPLGGQPPAGFLWRLDRQPDDLFYAGAGMAIGQDGNIYLVDALGSATPSSLAMDGDGNFYVGTWNTGVLKLDAQGNQVGQWGTNTDEEGPRAEGVLYYADAIVVDGEGNVYVCDWSSDYSYVTKFVFP